MTITIAEGIAILLSKNEKMRDRVQSKSGGFCRALQPWRGDLESDDSVLINRSGKA
jgi:hypothetical protein